MQTSQKVGLHSVLLMMGLVATISAASCISEELARIPRERGDLLPLVSSETVSLSGIGEVQDLRKLTGKSGTLIHFWALWCIPCRAEMVWVDSMRVRFGPQGVAFVGVTVDDRASDAIRFMEQYGGEGWPQLFDPDQEVYRAFGLYGLPDVFLFDAQRELVAFTNLGGSVVEAYLEEELQKLVAE